MNNLYINENSRTMEEICRPAAFTYQKQQQFVSRWFASGYSKLMLFHGIGSGKTCSSILIHLALRDQIKHTYVATPASLKENFKKELLGQCGKYKKMPENVSIMSHQAFAKLNANLDNCLVIVDEVQNAVSSSGQMYKDFFNKLVIKNYNVRVVLLSATPMFDQPHEIGLTMNLLNLPSPIDINTFYKTYTAKKLKSFKNDAKFVSKVYGYVSAFKGISPAAYAKRVDRTVMCNMESTQLNAYKIAVRSIKLPNNSNFKFSTSFLSGPRMAANMVYPNGGFGSKYRKDVKLQDYHISNLGNLSTKFATSYKNIEKSNGPVFVYTNFVQAGGIEDFKQVLLANGYVEFPKEGHRRFGIFRAGKDKENTKLIEEFNKIDNKNGDSIKLIIGSPAMKEGVSLKNTREVHLLDPYWNPSRTEQIIGRAIRFCSHVDLPKKERVVNVFHYAVRMGNKTRTVDEHIMAMSNTKQKMIRHFEKLLYKSAIDCPYFHNANGLKKTDCLSAEAEVKSPQNSLVISVTAKPDGILVPTNKDSEEMLEKYLGSLGLKIGGDKNPTGLEIVIPSFDKSLQFQFYNKKLNAMIYKTSYTTPSSGQLQIYIKIYNDGKAVKSPRKNNNVDNSGKTKELKFVNGKKRVVIVRGTGREKVNEKHKGCPKLRRPDENGKCPESFPFLHKKDGKECCYGKPDPENSAYKGLFNHKSTLYLNGQPPSKYTMSNLKRAYMNKFGTLPPKLSKKMLIVTTLIKLGKQPRAN